MFCCSNLTSIFIIVYDVCPYLLLLLLPRNHWYLKYIDFLIKLYVINRNTWIKALYNLVTFRNKNTCTRRLVHAYWLVKWMDSSGKYSSPWLGVIYISNFTNTNEMVYIIRIVSDYDRQHTWTLWGRCHVEEVASVETLKKLSRGNTNISLLFTARLRLPIEIGNEECE